MQSTFRTTSASHTLELRDPLRCYDVTMIKHKDSTGMEYHQWVEICKTHSAGNSVPRCGYNKITPRLVWYRICAWSSNCVSPKTNEISIAYFQIRWRAKLALDSFGPQLICLFKFPSGCWISSSENTSLTAAHHLQIVHAAGIYSRGLTCVRLPLGEIWTTLWTHHLDSITVCMRIVSSDLGVQFPDVVQPGLCMASASLTQRFSCYLHCLQASRVPSTNIQGTNRQW
jgi:hypothetical protein